jgi:antitoxin (DNA-binding transcriptional repressor) of toxin-antitoxin stability system
MKTATITQAKNQFSALIDLVKHGETVVILDRTIPVARLEPAKPVPGQDASGRLARLERHGLLKRAQGSLPKAFFTAALAPMPTGVSVADAVVAERDEGR